MKKLQVKCSGEPIRWADIVPLQPNGYKEQSELERDALIASMLTFGFNHPFAVWQHKGLCYSIDGVHRAKALKHLRDFGYNGESCEIPELLPSYSVEAETVEQAMAAILSYNEQYSTVANKAIIIEAAKLPATIIKAVMIKPPMVFNDSVRNNDSNNSNGDNGKSVGMGSVGDDLVVGGGESNVRYGIVEDEFDDSAAADLSIDTDIVIGDLFEIGKHRLMCGDSTKKDMVEQLMDGRKADIFITDPPYGVSYADKNKYLNTVAFANRIQVEIKNDHLCINEMGELWLKCFENANCVLNDISSYYIFSAQGGDLMMMMMMMIDRVFQLKHTLIWVKNNHVLGRCDYSYKHEPILYGWKKGGTHKFYGGFKTSILDFPKPLKNDLHPTMKPVALISELLNNSSKINDLVIDFFLGSGTTMLAAHQLDRVCYGMELDPIYCEVIIKRMLAFDNTLIIKRNSVDETEKWLSKLSTKTQA